jgi:hypothetical protein
MPLVESTKKAVFTTTSKGESLVAEVTNGQASIKYHPVGDQSEVLYFDADSLRQTSALFREVLDWLAKETTPKRAAHPLVAEITGVKI